MTRVSISPVESRQGLHMLFLLPQDSHTVEPELPSQICLAESLDSFKTQVSKIEHSILN